MKFGLPIFALQVRYSFCFKSLKLMNLIQKLSFFISFLISLTGSGLLAQSSVVINPPENIKSIVLRSQKTNDYAPIIRLGSSIVLEFDDLDSDQKQYSYTIEHYDYNWQKSNINPTEYIDGFTNDWIRNFENSFNTIQGYTHYRLRLPNDNLRIKISGNYVLSVLDEDDEVAFTRPFIVYEPLVDVGVSVHRSRDIATINTMQNIQFNVNHPNLLINNPRLELKVAIYQNLDWNTVIKDIEPQFIRGTQLLYKYGANVNFWGGNEFLFFDTKQIRGAVNNIARSELKDTFITYLYTDEERLYRPYTYYPDVNGNFVLRTIDAESIDTEGDYSWVYFTLESFENINQDAIYIYGDFNEWQLTDENKLSYNEQSRLYEGRLFLKQGFYNYSYITADEEGTVNNHSIDGSFHQTENNYTVLVYYKPIGTRYDQVIGIGNANSENLRN